MPLSPELIFAVIAIAIGLVLAFVLYRVSTKGGKNRKVTEEAVRQSYDHPERHGETREELKKELK
jgi:hypothetical protein